METPTLDRETPVPLTRPPQYGMMVVLILWYAMLAAAVIATFAGGTAFDITGWLIPEVRRLGPIRTSLSILGAYYGFIAIHEVGHAVAGLAAGFQFRSIRVGPVVVSRPRRVSIYRGPGALVNGMVELAPGRIDHLAARGIAMILAGPVANILTVVVILSTHTRLTLFTGCLLIFSLINAVNDLVPLQTRLGVSDGRRIAMLLSGDGRGERWLALLRLGADLTAGVSPDRLDPSLLRIAVAVRDASPDTSHAHAYAFQSATLRGAHEEAGRYLDTALEYSVHAAPVMKEALYSDAAVYQARRRHRADLASQWLAEIPLRSTHPWLRMRAEAAVLAATGDTAGATAKLMDVETAIAALPPGALRDVGLRSVRNWLGELAQDDARRRPVETG